MEYFDLIEKRYSVRKFKETEVPDSDIEKIVGAARIAPSGKNLQNWHFVAIKNKQVLGKMAEAVENRIDTIASGLPEDRGQMMKKFSKFSTFFANAPVVVAVYADKYVPEGYQELIDIKDDQVNIDRILDADPSIQSIGAAIGQLILAAFDMGYGACWMTSANNSLVTLEDVIGFKKEKYSLIALVPLGIPEGERKSPAKKELKEILTIIK